MKKKYLKPAPSPPAIRDAMAKASEREEKGLDVYDFSSGNIGRLIAGNKIFGNYTLSIEDIPEGFEQIAEALKSGIEESFISAPKGLAYSPTGGTEEQKKVAARYFNEIHNVPLDDQDMERVIITAGGQQAMAASLRSISPDAKVIAPRWDYAPVTGIAEDAPWDFVKLPANDELGFSLDALREEVEEGSVFYSSMPNNPTGYVSVEQLEGAARIMDENNGGIIWDAPYLFTMLKLEEGKAGFDSGFLESEVDRFSRLAKEYSHNMCILSSISKTCLAAGLRFGFATAPEEWIQNMNGIIGRENLSSPTPSFIMGTKILKAFLDKGASVHEWASEVLAGRINYLLEKGIPLLLPENGKFGALYVLMKAESSGDSFAEELAEKGIISVPAEPFFGGPVNYVRLSLVSTPFAEGDKLWKGNVDALAEKI